MAQITDRPARRRGKVNAVVLLAPVAFIGLYLVVDARWPIPLWVAALYAGASILCFIAYAVDKSAAVAGRRRVAERTLLLLGLIGGWPGAIAAQQWLRHKTAKASFQRVFWFSVAGNLAVFLLLATPVLPSL